MCSSGSPSAACRTRGLAKLKQGSAWPLALLFRPRSEDGGFGPQDSGCRSDVPVCTGVACGGGRCGRFQEGRYGASFAEEAWDFGCSSPWQSALDRGLCGFQLGCAPLHARAICMDSLPQSQALLAAGFEWLQMAQEARVQFYSAHETAEVEPIMPKSVSTPKKSAPTQEELPMLP